MKIKFSQEVLDSEIAEEMAPLTEAHIAEVGPFQFDFKINWSKYMALQAANSFRLFIVRNKEGKMVGYSSYFLSPHPHFEAATFAAQDSLYIIPSYRGKGKGARFIAYCESQLVDFCDAITQTVTPHFDFTDLLAKSGYVPLENIFVKTLVRTD